MEEFFFYCQIHSQGSDMMERWQISAKISLTEVASLMQALAYFPTNHEVTLCKCSDTFQQWIFKHDKSNVF